MLTLNRSTWLEILAEAWRVYPLEACGLLLGPDDGPVDHPIDRFVPIVNEAQSSRVFTLSPMGYMKAERLADDLGLQVVGVVHSHTHTSAYPSPTDVAEATKPLVPPTWHWAIVSLAWGYPELRSFRVHGPGEGAGSDPVGLGMDEEPVWLKD